MASLGRASTVTVSPSCSIQTVAKNVSSFRSETTTRVTDAPSPFAMLRIRSCVIGLGVAVFSSSSAIAFASNTPTQIGSTSSLAMSFNTTMGMFVTGIEHEAAYLNLDFSGIAHRTASATRLFGNVCVTRTVW